MAQVVPGGFGGLYQRLNADGSQASSLVVFLKDPARVADARPAIQLVLECDGAYPGWLGERVDADVIECRQGEFTAEELLGYLRALEPLLNDPDVWAMESDSERNRVWLGLRQSTSRSRIEAMISQAGVPASAVLIEDPPPPIAGAAFEVLEETVHTRPFLGTALGLFEFHMHVRYTNAFPETRYPYPCVLPLSSHLFFEFVLTKWNGSEWTRAFKPICELVAHLPRPVAPGAQQTDSVPVAAGRRLNTLPIWETTRITGTYRFEGVVFLTTIPSPPFVANSAPLEQRISSPFRIVASPGAP